MDPMIFVEYSPILIRGFGLTILAWLLGTVAAIGGMPGNARTGCVALTPSGRRRPARMCAITVDTVASEAPRPSGRVMCGRALPFARSQTRTSPLMTSRRITFPSFSVVSTLRRNCCE